MLNLALIIATVTVLTLGLVTTMSAWWAIIPAMLTAASLVASHRADLAAAARDRQDCLEMDAVEERLLLTAQRMERQRTERLRQVRAVREARSLAAVESLHSTSPAVAEPQSEATPNGSSVAVIDVQSEEAPADEAQAAAGSTQWTPTSVPAPTYAMKAPARRAVDPYQAEDSPGAAVPVRPTAPTQARAPLGSGAHAAKAERAAHEEPAQTIDLASVLERRRAKGA